MHDPCPTVPKRLDQVQIDILKLYASSDWFQPALSKKCSVKTNKIQFCSWLFLHFLQELFWWYIYVLFICVKPAYCLVFIEQFIKKLRFI